MSGNKKVPKFEYHQPCFGFFLQGAVKALAVTDVGVEIAMIFVLSVGIYSVLEDWRLVCHSETMDNLAKCYLRPVHWWYYFLYNVVSIKLSNDLYIAATNRDLHELISWLLSSIVLYLPWLVFFMVHTIWIEWAHPMGAATFGGFAGYKLYSFWLVYSFIKETQRYFPINKALSTLPDHLFEEWNQDNPALPASNPKITGKSYKSIKGRFERHRKDIKLLNTLGRGAFGVVYKAELRNRKCSPSGATKTVVALKMVYPDSDIFYLQALLSELRILCNIGRHEHIVNLVGACTSEVKRQKSFPYSLKGNVYVMVEFCAHGSMSTYLKANRGVFVEEAPDGYVLPEGTPTTRDLIKWSMQTAMGMEYIASKNVIHGDLAARNVLLTAEKDIKIADFGLSQQLYHYSYYKEHKNKLQPWRWMALESMLDLSFSSMSDVWGFGVTLWEYFTLGAAPFPNYNYCPSFVEGLRSGELKLEKPSYASEEIYSKMLECCNVVPQERPTFTELKYFFEGQYQPCESEPALENESNLCNDSNASFVPNEEYSIQIIIEN